MARSNIDILFAPVCSFSNSSTSCLVADELPLLAHVRHKLETRRVEEEGVLLTANVMKDRINSLYRDVALGEPSVGGLQVWELQ
jgi:hypothetical protein